MEAMKRLIWLYRIFCNPGTDKALTFSPTYGMYKVSADINNVELLEVPLNHNFDIELEKAAPILDTPNLKLIFLCSPNNPTGNSLTQATVEFFLKNFQGIVVVDEAYIDFSSKPSFVSIVREFPNLVVLQTMSKAWGLAAARVGFAFASAEIIQLLNKVKPPYNVSDQIKFKR